MSLIPLYIAFSAGIVSFLSPCVLPLVPGYISYISGVSAYANSGELKRGLVISRALFFNLGFMLVFVLLGVTGSYFGKLLFDYKDLITKVGGVIIFVMGMQMAGLLKLQFLYRTYKINPHGPIKGHLGAFMVGLTFAAGWTPCVGPVLGSILVYAGMTGTVSKGALLLAVYSLGLAVPFMFAAIGIDKAISYLPRFNKYLSLLSVISGVVMMLVGALLFFNIFQRLSAYLTF